MVEQYRSLRDEIRNMILSRLNIGQRQAAETGYGPVLCLAGAGSGKTTAMVYRILHLLAFGPVYDLDSLPAGSIGEDSLGYMAQYLGEQGKGSGPVLTRHMLELIGQQGVPMYHILAITFTNKAAREMRERLEAMIDGDLGDMWVMTFHSACLRILKRESQYLEGYNQDFSIYDASDQEQVVRGILRGLNLEEKEHPARVYVNWISSQKSNMRMPIAGYTASSRKLEQLRPLVYARYQQELMKNNAMDFDDLLLQTVLLFQRQPACLAKYQDRFRFIMVDEYQDTNHIQYMLVKMLAQEHGNLCVVGDDDQSIYSFRQADIRNILDFENDFAGAAVIRMEQNYRSTGRILEAANALIAQNKERKGKNLFTEKQQGEKLYVYSASDDKDEAGFVCSRVQVGREMGLSFSDHAVLMRTNAQSRVIEECFAANRVPYVMIGGIRFYERKEIKDILAYLKLIANPEDQVAFRRIVNEPRRGIGDVTVSRVIALSGEGGRGLSAALYDKEGLGLSSRADHALEAFRLLYRELRMMAEEQSVAQLVQSILTLSGYRKMLLEKETLENRDRWDNLLEFLNKAEEYDKQAADSRRQAAEYDGAPPGSLADFLGEISLITDLDLAEDGERKGAVQVLTMHMAKGLEFRQVFMVGMEERIFPHARSLTDGEIEEERRLCYVAMTRAEEKLYLSWAERRNQYGSYTDQLPSRFLREIPEQLVENDGYGSRWSGGSAQRGTVSAQRSVVNAQRGTANAQRSTVNAQSRPSDTRRYGNRPFHADYDEAQSSAYAEGTPADLPKKERFKPGDKVNHRLWGPGVVVSTNGVAASLTYTVAFPDKGLRVLQADVAPLERML